MRGRLFHISKNKKIDADNTKSSKTARAITKMKIISYYYSVLCNLVKIRSAISFGSS